jgi:alcohol dehydrogenase
LVGICRKYWIIKGSKDSNSLWRRRNRVYSYTTCKAFRCICSNDINCNDKQFAKELGADKVIDYKKENFEDTIHEHDAVFDIIGGDTCKKSFRVLKKGSGIIVSMLEQPNSELMSHYGVKALFQFTQVNRERLTKLAQWVDQNNIKVNVNKTFSLHEAAKALDYQKDVHPRGKVILTV